MHRGNLRPTDSTRTTLTPGSCGKDCTTAGKTRRAAAAAAAAADQVPVQPLQGRYRPIAPPPAAAWPAREAGKYNDVANAIIGKDSRCKPGSRSRASSAATRGRGRYRRREPLFLQLYSKAERECPTSAASACELMYAPDNAGVPECTACLAERRHSYTHNDEQGQRLVCKKAKVRGRTRRTSFAKNPQASRAIHAVQVGPRKLCYFIVNIIELGVYAPIELGWRSPTPGKDYTYSCVRARFRRAHSAVARATPTT
jgi:hypothetical protein